MLSSHSYAKNIVNSPNAVFGDVLVSTLTGTTSVTAPTVTGTTSVVTPTITCSGGITASTLTATTNITVLGYCQGNYGFVQTPNSTAVVNNAQVITAAKIINKITTVNGTSSTTDTAANYYALNSFNTAPAIFNGIVVAGGNNVISPGTGMTVALNGVQGATVTLATGRTYSMTLYIATSTTGCLSFTVIG
jgi:hypothetical protein